MVGYYHHFGDFARDAGNLNITQFGVYRALLDWYYIHEQPLPSKVEECAHLLPSLSRGGRIRPVVEEVLQRFFLLREDGWHHTRCDKEIRRYQASQPRREAKRENTAERNRRYRQNRSDLFKALRNAGCTMDFDSSMEDLRNMAIRMGIPNPCQYTDDLTLPRDASHDAVTNGAQANTVTHLGDGGHNPEPLSLNPLSERVTVRDGARSEARARCVEAAIACRKAGMQSANADDPRLQQLVGEGVLPEAFEVAAAQCIAMDPPKNWGYMLAMMKGQRQDAAARARNGPGAANAALVRAYAPLAAARPLQPDSEVLDVNARRVD